MESPVELMYALQLQAAIALVLIWGWTPPTLSAVDVAFPFCAQLPRALLGHGISNATPKPREMAPQQLPSHPPLGAAADWPAQLPTAPAPAE